MASRPPDDRPTDEQARNRWMVIQAMRLGGIAMVIVALLALRGIVPMPDAAAYVLLGVGLVDVFLVPTLLARKWSSRRQ
jgi:hypothetical protein